MSTLEIVGLVTATIRIVQQLRAAVGSDAPKEVAELFREVTSVRAAVEIIQLVSTEDSSEEPVQTALLGLNNTLSDAARVLEKWQPVGGTGAESSARPNLAQRYRWATKDKAKVQALTATLKSYDRTLMTWLQLQSLRASSRGLDMTLTHLITRAEEVKAQADKLVENDTIIALMGETGSGKSSFIQRITGSDAVQIGHGLQSETRSVQAYSVTIGGRLITLVDTPGFDDTNISDADVLQELSSWLTASYKSQRLLSGIIYMHPIDLARMRGSSRRSLDVFGKLVGADAFNNIVLVTTKWDALKDPDIGVAREAELLRTWWKDFLEHGSTVARSYGDRQSALAIVKQIVFGRTASETAGAPVALQTEMVDEHKSLEETSAGQMLLLRMNELEQMYKTDVSELKNELSRSSAAAAEDRRQMQAEVTRLQNEQLTLREDHRRMKSQPSDTTRDMAKYPIESLKPQIHVQIGLNELLEADLPPPYSPRRTTWNTGFIAAFMDTVAFSLMPIVEGQRFVRSTAGKLLRPRLQADHSRLEWTCACGDVLWGDYIERTPGSLQKLAADLGGKVTQGPAVRQVPANSKATVPQVPAKAHLQGSSSAGASGGTAGGPSGNSNPPPGGQGPSNGTGRGSGGPPNPTPTGQGPPASGGQTGTATQQHTTENKWLELCIRSSADVSVLAEIDIAGAQTDQHVFEAIRNAYQERKTSARLFGRFAYRVTNGGGSVMFRKDKLASPSGDPPTVSIMKRQAMPNESEAQQYHYNFDPIPMDEPSIDSRTFHHYLKNPHFADPLQAWINRFPQLNGASLFFNNEKLAKGWGMEITEDRNVLLLLLCNLCCLLLSGAVAAIYAFFTKDNPTAVAIGAWLTAVQTLGVTALLWSWMS